MDAARPSWGPASAFEERRFDLIWVRVACPPSLLPSFPPSLPFYECMWIDAARPSWGPASAFKERRFDSIWVGVSLPPSPPPPRSNCVLVNR